MTFIVKSSYYIFPKELLWLSRTCILLVICRSSNLFIFRRAAIPFLWIIKYPCLLFFIGAFLFPYLFMLIVVGYPLMFLEMSFGQFSSLGCISIWRMSPLFKGMLSITHSYNKCELSIGEITRSITELVFANKTVAGSVSALCNPS